jgi:nucleoside-diphosphate-sugar epimerase
MFKNIFITGSSGFVGKNLIKYLESSYLFYKYQKNSLIDINHDIIIHLAGKAHDLKNVSSSDDYYNVNTELTKKVFDEFLSSNVKVFITLSSVKAVADEVSGELTEDVIPHPITHYGKSKLLAEDYILSKFIPEGKRFFILRPCMIHGPDNKGNLNLLFKYISKGFPWPLGSFDNKRSFCSIDNLCFVIKELIENENIPSGVYNVADDEQISTNEIINLISNSLSKDVKIFNLPKSFIKGIAKIGDILKLPLNSESLLKLTESYIVSNKKLKLVLNKPFPISLKNGLLTTFRSLE